MKGTRQFISGRIKPTSEMISNCKHKFKPIIIKSWFAIEIYLYCSKCGGWKELL